MTTKNRKQIVESVKTHNQVFVKNLLLEQAETTFLGKVQSAVDMTALGSGLAGGALMFVPGLQPVGAGLLAFSRGAGLVGGGIAAARGVNRMVNPMSGEVAPAAHLFTDAAIGLGLGKWISNPSAKAAENVDKQINKIVKFRNELGSMKSTALGQERKVTKDLADLTNLNARTPGGVPNFHSQRDALKAERKRISDELAGYQPDSKYPYLAKTDPGLEAVNAAKTAKQQGNLWKRGSGDIKRWVSGSDELIDIDRINRYVAARGGVIKTDKQLGNLDFIPRGKWEKPTRVFRTIGIPNIINLVRPQGLIGRMSDDNPNYDDSVLRRMFMGSGGAKFLGVSSPFGPSSWSTKMRVRPAPGFYSPAELVGQEIKYPTQAALQTFGSLPIALY